MTTIQKLKAIEKKKVIYNILFRRAGVGFMFYDEARVPEKDRAFRAGNDGWRKGLVVEKYYPTFVKAVDAEFKKL